MLMAIGRAGDLDIVGVGRGQARVVLDPREPVAALVVGVFDVEFDRGNAGRAGVRPLLTDEAVAVVIVAQRRDRSLT